MPPLFNITKLLSLADDNHIIGWNGCSTTMNEEMSTTLNLIIKCLKDFGLKVNQSNREICIFHKNSYVKTFVNDEHMFVESSDYLNVLGVEFDFKV
jgi:hypothetical protein